MVIDMTSIALAAASQFSGGLFGFGFARFLAARSASFPWLGTVSAPQGVTLPSEEGQL
jgi:hypothetical protein